MAFYDDVHTTKRFRLGTRVKDVAGNEYIYLTGVASTVDKDWVTFDEVHITTRAAAGGKGRVAIANAAVDAATEFGWYGIYGSFSGNVLTGFVDNADVWLTATAGSVDDADVAGDAIVGAVGRSAVASGVATFELNYPWAGAPTID